jgi:hypothetical protein
MTVAVCIRCGTIKFGALSTCEQCGFTPDHKDKAQAKLCLMLSDHFNSVEELEKIGKDIAEGAKIEVYDSATVEQAIKDYNRAVELYRSGQKEASLELARKAHSVFQRCELDEAEASGKLVAHLERELCA